MKDGKVLEVSSGKKKCDCNTGARHQCGIYNRYFDVANLRPGRGFYRCYPRLRRLRPKAV